MKEDINEKRCVLCNRPYNYKYDMFGRGCLDNMYDLLEITKSPRLMWNKELYLCTRIAWRNHKFFLSKNKKYNLTQKYIALQYLDKMNYEFLDDIKKKIKNDINSISTFSKNIVETVSFTLTDIYKLFNYSQKFDKLIKEFQNINWEEIDEKVAENFIKSMSFIFDVTRKSDTISYTVFYSMQYTFWQVVVVGGILTNKKLSAILLNHSLSLFGKSPENLIINDDEILNSIIKDETFKNKVREKIENNQEENEIHLDNIPISFENGDLLYALHNATMKINASKNENDVWIIDVEIADTYDFTDFKQLKEYMDKKDNILTDIMATTLNNFGVVSSEYGVLKIYDLKINLKLDSMQL